jgi:hypothetical protein
MKLSDLHTCDGCEGPLVTPPEHWFWRVRVSGARVDLRAATRVVGHSLVSGIDLKEAEAACVDGGANVVEILADRDPRLEEELLVCTRCHGSKTLAEISLHHARAKAS